MRPCVLWHYVLYAFTRRKNKFLCITFANISIFRFSFDVCCISCSVSQWIRITKRNRKKQFLCQLQNVHCTMVFWWFYYEYEMNALKAQTRTACKICTIILNKWSEVKLSWAITQSNRILVFIMQTNMMWKNESKKQNERWEKIWRCHWTRVLRKVCS